MRLADLVETSAAVRATRSRNEKRERLAAALRAADPETADVAVSYLTGALRQPRTGLGPAALRAIGPVEPVAAPQLDLREVDAGFAAIAAIAGPGAKAAREGALRALLARATAAEQDFLARLVVGELRQGALAESLTDAIAAAKELPPATVRRAAMLSGDLRAVARAVFAGEDLASFRLQVGRPIQPMLAQTAASVDEPLERWRRAAFETKLDGARVQIHRHGDEVRVFSRLLNDVTSAVPEVVAAARALPARSIVLDGEAIALGGDGRPLPFQQTMRRFGRKSDAGALLDQLPLRSFCFDVLHLDGEDLIDRPAGERAARLDALLPDSMRVARCVTADAEEAEAFFARTMAAGHEGLLAKDLDAPYEAGRRGAAWLKIKPAHTLDLVVLAAEWGSGRREGWLSNLHLGARGESGFVMVGKTFKGMTDELLAWQTVELQRIADRREGHVVHVAPVLVVEVAFDGVQRSSQYPGGAALRFARVRRYRPDKTPEFADTIATVRALGGLDAE